MVMNGYSGNQNSLTFLSDQNVGILLLNIKADIDSHSAIKAYVN
jgi:hypothetical protein